MSINLLPGKNRSGTVKYKSVAMVDGSLFIMYSVSYDIVDEYHRKEVVVPLSKNTDARS